jgi:hypothetical protein
VRVLVDESLPQELAAELGLPDVRTVGEQGWSGLKNGALLQRAETAGFTVFLTADQNLPYQQNVPAFRIAVMVLKARSNRIQDLRPFLPKIRQALSIVSPGQVLRLGN